MAKKITLTITTGHDAFDDGRDGAIETARILHDAANRMAGHGLDYVDGDGLRDANGNTVGRVRITRAR